MGNSFGCSASGERLVSAARDGDFQEAQALLECNPRLAKYSTFGVRNSPLHFSAMQGHNEVSSSMSLKPFFFLSLSFGRSNFFAAIRVVVFKSSSTQWKIRSCLGQ